MPTKIGFTVISSTGEDERYRATDLNYHGPTVKGWRSAQDCSYPQEITLQLHALAIVHRIQILAHQYLIPHKIEIWTCEDVDYDVNSSNSFTYLGFITLSDNQATAFKSRELKSVTTPPTAARYVRLRLHTNHRNDKNVYNQVGLVAVSVLGEEIIQHDTYGDDLNNNGQFDSLPSSDATLISNPQYTSPYDDLAFEMYVDKDVARIMRLMEAKKHQAVIEERFEYARKLKVALEELKEAGETLGRYEQEKRQAINLEDYDKAKSKKILIDEFRDEVYSNLHVEQLLELDGPMDSNDWGAGSPAVYYGKARAEPQPEPEPEPEEPQLSPPTLRLEVDTRSPRHPRYTDNISPQVSEPYATWSPHRPFRRTSFSDYSTQRAVSPTQLSHSYSQTAFPTSVNSQYTRKVHSETPTPQFQCYTPYSQLPVLNVLNQTTATEAYHSLPPIHPHDPFYLQQDVIPTGPEILSKLPQERSKSPTNSNTSRSPTNMAPRQSTLRVSQRRRKQNGTVSSKNSYEAYEERMLPALRHPHFHGNEVVRECQLAIEQTRKSKLNERERKQAALPISVFGIELVEQFYSKHFADKEEGLRLLQEEMKEYIKVGSQDVEAPPRPFSANKMARAAIFLLHRALRDKVYSVYSGAADAIRFFFTEFVPTRVSSAEVARSVEKLLPELIAKSGDVTPRIHNMAAHTLLSMADCKEVRNLHIIPVHLSRPLSSSVHPRLALSRLEMVEQLILNHGISTEKQSGLTCRTLAEFGSSGLHHPAEAVRKVAERILVHVYQVNPRLVRKQLPPDDDVTRRNLLYRQLFQEFDQMDMQKRRERKEAEIMSATLPKPTKKTDLLGAREDKPSEVVKSKSDNAVHNMVSQIPKRTVNQQTSPLKPFIPTDFDGAHNDENQNRVRPFQPPKIINEPNGNGTRGLTMEKPETLSKRRNMSRISEETYESEVTKEKEGAVVHFPNLVDSVHVAESRLPLLEKSVSKLKSLKYIFPTSYIGTSTKSQETVNKSNSVTTFCKLTTDFNASKSHTFPTASGIPIPKNGFNSRHTGLINTLLSTKKVGIKSNEKKDGTALKKLTEQALANTDMITALYVPSASDEITSDQTNGASEVLAETSSSSASVVSPPSEREQIDLKRDKDGMSCKTCIFCFEKEDWFTEESLNIHYWKNCPMLTRCSECKEVVEISGLIHHRLDDCENRSSYTKCTICQEAILKGNYENHECMVSTSSNSKVRCTLCHSDLNNEDAWRDHLMGDNICKNHPRKRPS